MYKVMPTIPVSDLRTKQAKVLTDLKETPILLTQRGHSAGILVHPDLWNEMVEMLTDYQDMRIVRDRIHEAEDDPAILRPISELRALLEAEGLLDE